MTENFELPYTSTPVYSVSDASQHALCRAHLELLSACKTVSSVNDCGIDFVSAVKTSISEAERALSKLSGLLDEDLSKVNAAKEILRDINGGNSDFVSPEKISLIQARVGNALYQLLDTSVLSVGNDSKATMDQNTLFLQECDRLLSRCDDLLDALRLSSGAPLIRAYCSIKIAAKQLSSINDLNADDSRTVGGIAAFLAVLPTIDIIIDAGKGPNLQKALFRAIKNLTIVMQHVFRKDLHRKVWEKEWIESSCFNSSKPYQKLLKNASQ